MNDSFSINIEARCQVPNAFMEVMRLVGADLVELSGQVGVAPPVLTVVVASDFTAEVENAWKMMEGATSDSASERYTTGRVGGEAYGKTITMTADGSRSRIILNSTLFELGEIWVITLAHEATHALLDRLRAESGALDGVQVPDHTPWEKARAIVRQAVDELRCDLMANDFLLRLTTALSVEAEGGTRPVGLADVINHVQRDDFTTALDQVVYPGWPDAVDAFKNEPIDVTALWNQIGGDTGQMMTFLAHVQARADSAHQPGPAHEQGEAHPGMSLYIGPAWDRILGAVGEVIPPLSEFRDRELALLDVGEQAILEMWERLGLTFTLVDPAERSFYIQVRNPTR